MSSLPLGTSIFIHGVCKQLKRKRFQRKIYTPKDAARSFPNFSPIVCDVYADSMSIPNPNNSGHQYPHQSLSHCTYTEAYLLCSQQHRQQLLLFPAYLIPNIGISGPRPRQFLNLDLKNLTTGVTKGVKKF